MYLDLSKNFRVECFFSVRHNTAESLFRILCSAKENKQFEVNYAHNFPLERLLRLKSQEQKASPRFFKIPCPLSGTEQSLGIPLGLKIWSGGHNFQVFSLQNFLWYLPCVLLNYKEKRWGRGRSYLCVLIPVKRELREPELLSRVQWRDDRQWTEIKTY